MVIDRYDMAMDSEQETYGGRRDRGESRPRGESAGRRRQTRRKAAATPGSIRLRRNKRWSW